MEILYEDKDIIVVHKEAGLPVQAAGISKQDMVSMLKNHLRQEEVQEKNQPLSSAEKKAAKNGEPYLGIVHRLDQPVEGILVFAKNNKAAGQLSRQVQAKAGQGAGSGPDRTAYSDMRKVYQAVVLLQDQAAYEKAKKAEHSVVTLQDYLRRNFSKNMTEVVPEGTKNSQWAELTFRTLKIWKEQGKALLEIHLHTGRHHQIRVQLAHAGLPLDGDRKYGPAGQFYDYDLRLCAASLQFRHPSTGKKMQFSVKPPFADLEEVGNENPSGR